MVAPLLVRTPLELLHGGLLCLFQWSPVYWWQGSFSSLGGFSSVIMASGSCCVAAKDSVIPRVLGIGVPQSLRYAGTLLQMLCAGSSLTVAHCQHTI